MRPHLRRTAWWGWHLVRSHWALLLILIIALTFRLTYLSWFKTMPGGDVYNFLSIARGLPRFEYAAHEKRLPFFPLLILPARSVLDWEQAAMVVDVTASLAALVFLYALGRTFGLSKTALAAALLVFQSHSVILVATRGYADHTLIAVLLASLLALVRTRTWRGGVASGLLFGAAALTRYEGLAAALVALPFWIAFPRGLRRRVPALALAVFLASLLPYVSLSAANGRPLVGAEYFERTDTEYGAPDVAQFRANLYEIWRRNGFLEWWKLPASIGREIGEEPFAIARIISSRVLEPGTPLSLLAVIGVANLLARRSWRVLALLFLTYGAVTIPPAYWAPFRRYDAFLLPLLFLLAAAGLACIQRFVERATTGRSGRQLRLAGAAVLFLVVGFWTTFYARETRDVQTKRNGRGYAHYQAIHAARKLPGTVAFAVQGVPAEFYFSGRAVYLDTLLRSGVSADGLLDRFRSAHVTFIVLPAPKVERFPFLADPSVEEVRRFSWPEGDGGTSLAAIYRLER